MSNDALNWAFSQQVTPTQKLVLVALANRSDNDGQCWPSIKALTEDTSLSDRAVQYAIKGLASAGLLSASLKGGNKNIFTLFLGVHHVRINARVFI